jgi:hypothetical protein
MNIIAMAVMRRGTPRTQIKKVNQSILITYKYPKSIVENPLHIKYFLPR